MTMSYDLKSELYRLAQYTLGTSQEIESLKIGILKKLAEALVYNGERLNPTEAQNYNGIRRQVAEEIVTQLGANQEPDRYTAFAKLLALLQQHFLSAPITPFALSLLPKRQQNILKPLLAQELARITSEFSRAYGQRAKKIRHPIVLQADPNEVRRATEGTIGYFNKLSGDIYEQAQSSYLAMKYRDAARRYELAMLQFDQKAISDPGLLGELSKAYRQFLDLEWFEIITDAARHGPARSQTTSELRSKARVQVIRVMNYLGRLVAYQQSIASYYLHEDIVYAADKAKRAYQYARMYIVDILGSDVALVKQLDDAMVEMKMDFPPLSDS